MTRLPSIMKIANETAHKKGWYDKGERNIGEVIALMHSELSEALEETRISTNLGLRYRESDNKPEGFVAELADVIIRIADTCEELGLPLITAIEKKMEYNKTREYRHGGKLS